MSGYRMKLRVVAAPLTDSDCTNPLVGLAPAAVIEMLPAARWMRIDGKVGPCSASVSAPGVAGYMPSAAHTYHAEVAPRSSLPGSPPALVLKPSVITLCTARAVHKVMTDGFNTSAGGLPGNDDLGATSAWYVWAALGMYPATPGADTLALHGP